MYSASINWGDESYSQGTVTGGYGGQFYVSGAHTYQEESASGYNVTVSILDEKDYNDIPVNATVPVADGALTATGLNFQTTTGQPFNGNVASFTDQGTDTYSLNATIDWGDGTTSTGTVTGGNNIGGSHTYAESGIYSVAVTIDDDGGSSASATGTADVTIPTGTLSASGNDLSATEKVDAYGTVASFSDTDGQTSPSAYYATIDWGDGQSSTGGIALTGTSDFLVGGDHTYAEEGSYTISVSITDSQDGSTASTTSTADVADGNITTTGMTFYPSVGQLYSGVVAGFTDQGMDPASLNATIDWGDGTPGTPGTISGAGSSYSVSGSHTYAQKGTYAVNVTINDDETSGSAASTAEVFAGTLTVSGTTMTASEGVSAGGTVATFTDSDPYSSAGNYAATIDWGDGSPADTGFVTGSNGSYAVTGSHTYKEESAPGAPYPIQVAISDSDGASGGATTLATVTDAPLRAQGRNFSATTGKSFTGMVATFTDPAATLDTTAIYSATISWGDAANSAGKIIPMGGGQFAVQATHTYTVPGQHQVTVTITDDGGASTSVTMTATVTLNPPLPAGTPPDHLWNGAGPNPEVIGTNPNVDDGNTAAGFSDAFVRYFDGTLKVDANDLTAAGFGSLWGQSRSWTNNANYLPPAPGPNLPAPTPLNGNGWIIDQLPYLLQDPTGNHIAVITNGTNARYFDLNPITSAYSPRFFLQETLIHDQANNQFVLTDTTGDGLRFWDFNPQVPIPQQGQFQRFTDPSGTETSVTSRTVTGQPQEVQRYSSVGGTPVTESYLYNYVPLGQVNAGLLAGVTLRRQVNGGSWTTIRQVVYTYYDGIQPYGNLGDLQTAAIEDASGNVLDTSYYRYYTNSDFNPDGYVHGLKYYFSPASYARLAAAVGNPLTATDAQVEAYAHGYYQYDSDQRVTQAVIQGAGGSGTGGLGTFSYEYFVPSSFTNNYNSWKYKTVEILPDGNQQTVYANYAGEVMLVDFQNTTTLENWDTYYQYDKAGRLILTANPSAVTGYDENQPDLLDNGNGTYLSANQGLIQTTTYYTDTNGTETIPGSVNGYVDSRSIQQGELGTPVPQETTLYYVHSGLVGTVAPVASDTVYRNTDGTGAEVTNFRYTWYYDTTQMQSETVSLPVVSAAQNGPGASDVSTTYFDQDARPIWTQDPQGFLTYTAYDEATGAVVKTITDVQTQDSGDFQNLPAGWVTPQGGGLHLITQMAVDGLGRDTAVTSPNGNVNYILYDDPDHESRTYVGWNAFTYQATGPTLVQREDRPGSYEETLTMSAAPAYDPLTGRPTGTEPISNLQTLSRTYVSAGGQVVRQDDYFNLTGLNYSTQPSLGTVNVNYYSTLYGYDPNGRPSHTQDPTGTITDTVYDGLGRWTSILVGTNDTTANNMTQISSAVYDNGKVGDGNLTQETDYPDHNDPPRVTQNYYDWRDRLVATKEGVQTNENDGTHRPIFYTTYDNLDEPVTQEQYAGDGVAIPMGTDGVPIAPGPNLLQAQVTNAYDDQGRLYQTQTWDVNPATGAVGATPLTTSYWFDQRGNLLEEADPGGLDTKMQYDGAGRQTVQYTTDGGGGTSWNAAGTVAGDTVLSQVETQYDGDGNPILTTDRERYHDETFLGPLGDPHTTPQARVYYVASYYDAADRLTNTVDVGTNGGFPYLRRNVVPTPSATTLVSSYGYNAAGWVGTTTDSHGLETQESYDNLGRTTQTIEDYTNGVPTAETNRTTKETYDGDNNVLSVTAVDPNQPAETTDYSYQVRSAGGQGLTSNDLLATVQDPTLQGNNSPQKEGYTYNALGQVLTYTDRNGTVHTYSYDVLGRQTADAVTTLGAGVDGAVRRLETAYDTAGRPYLFTSYDAPEGGNVVNQVQDTFNGLGQLTGEYQSHQGLVNPAITPQIQYAYSEMAGEANNSRLVSLTYPNGRVLHYGYNSGLDDAISRLSFLADDNGSGGNGQHLEEYSYLGLNTVVQQARPQTGVNLTYIQQPGDPAGDAGDQYTGLDRFGRVVDQRWLVTSNGTATDRFQYGYDQNDNVLYRNNLVNPAFGELYHGNGPTNVYDGSEQSSGPTNGYDGLDQLTAFSRGVLSSSTGPGGVLDTVANPTHSQSWSLDLLGNWNGFTSDGVTQTRIPNSQNQVAEINNQNLSYDQNGNTTLDDQGHTLVYDAWNRLVRVMAPGGGALAVYAYDALNRRIVENHGTPTDLYYSADWQVLEERQNVQGSSQMTAQYVWGPKYVDALVLRDRPLGNGQTERLYVQQDANWNVTALVDNSGNVVERYDYDPYGQPTVLTPDWQVRNGSQYGWKYLFQGARYDRATGLYNFQSRDESPTLGRWIEQDPIGFAGGIADLYGEEGNDPTSETDPSGLEGEPTNPVTFVRPSCMMCHGRLDSKGRVDMWALPEGQRIWAARWLDANTTDPNELQRRVDRITAFGPTQFSIGFGQGAYHTGTHPWEIVTDPAKMGYNVIFDPAQADEDFDKAGEALILHPAHTVGTATGSAAVTFPLALGGTRLLRVVGVGAAASGEAEEAALIRQMQADVEANLRLYDKIKAEKASGANGNTGGNGGLNGQGGGGAQPPGDGGVPPPSGNGSGGLLPPGGGPPAGSPLGGGTPMPPNGGVFTQANILGGIGPSQPGIGPFSQWLRLGPNGLFITGTGGLPLPGFDGPINPKPPGPIPPPFSPN